MKRGNKVLVIIVIMLILLLMAGGAFAYVYLATDLLKSDKEMFFKYFSQITTEDQFFNKSINEFNEKKQQTPYENVGEFSIIADFPEELGIAPDKVNDLSIRFSGETDIANQKVEQAIEVDYGNDVIFPLTYRQYENTFGLQFDHFGKKFIAIKNENLKQFAQKFGIEDVTEIPDVLEASEITQEIEFSQEEIEQLKQIYLTALNEQLLDENFSSEKSSTSENYILQLSGEQQKNIVIKILEATKQNPLVINKINELIASVDEEAETIEVDAIDDIIESINEEDISEMPVLKIMLVQQEKMLNQILISSGNNQVTILKTASGDKLSYAVESILEASADEEDEDEENTQVECNFTVEYTGLQTLENVEENYEIAFYAKSEDFDMNYDYQISNDIQFKDSVSIETFEDTGAVILNDHDATVITNFMGQVITRLVEINKNQMTELGLKEMQNPLLYTNPITGLGLTIFNMGNESVEEEDFSDYEIQLFNSKFERYIGEDVLGSIVNSLIDIIYSSNLTNEDFVVDITLDGNELSQTDKVDSMNKYSVEAIYGNDGRITEIKITTNS